MAGSTSSPCWAEISLLRMQCTMHCSSLAGTRQSRTSHSHRLSRTSREYSRCSSLLPMLRTPCDSPQGKHYTSCTQYWPPRPGTRPSSRRTCRSCLSQRSPASSLLHMPSTRSTLLRCTLQRHTLSRPLHSSHSRAFLVYTPSKRQHPCRLGIC